MQLLAFAPPPPLVEACYESRPVAGVGHLDSVCVSCPSLSPRQIAIWSMNPGNIPPWFGQRKPHVLIYAFTPIAVPIVAHLPRQTLPGRFVNTRGCWPSWIESGVAASFRAFRMAPGNASSWAIRRMQHPTKACGGCCVPPKSHGHRMWCFPAIENTRVSFQPRSLW